MKLKYVELPTERIFNWLDPFNVTAKWACKAITGDWWTSQNVEIRKYFAEVWTEEFDKITGHFTDLEESIKEKGILTPISTQSGPPRGTYLKPHHFPPDEQHDLTKAISTFTFGGSRLTIANKLGIEKVPCIVHDFANLFPQAQEVTKSNFTKWFGNEYVFNTQPPCLRIKHMSHIKNKKYNCLNKGTREAQGNAATVARAKTYAKYGLVGEI